VTGVVIVPSRGRPDSIARLVEAFRATGASAVRLIVAVDDDDPTLDDYRAVALPNGAALSIGPRSRIGAIVNDIAGNVAAFHDWVGFMGDDHRPRTADWPDLVDEALAGGPGVVYGDDLFQRQNLPTAVFMSSSIIQRLGYMHPPGLWHLYLDNFWMELGRETRLVYEPRMVIEHLHPFAGKAEMDDGYRANNSPETNEHDRVEFQRYMMFDWPAAKAKLADLLAGAPR
jgi:hypothetical protein